MSRVVLLLTFSLLLFSSCKKSEGPTSNQDGTSTSITGEKWSAVNNGLVNSKVSSIICTQAGALLACTPIDGGIYQSTNSGDTWRLVFGLGHAQGVMRLVTCRDDMIFLLSPQTVLLSTNGGGIWIEADTGIVLNPLASNASLCPSANGVIYLAMDTCVYRSTNGGTRWSRSAGTDLGGSIVQVGEHLYATSARISYLEASQHGNIFALNYDIALKSTNGGDTWVRATNNSGCSLEIAPDGSLWMGRARSISRSTDEGTTWTQLSSLDFQRFVRFAFDPAGAVFAVNQGGGIFRSRDAGKNWTVLSNGISVVAPVSELAISPKGYIFAATDDGVYRSR